MEKFNKKYFLFFIAFIAIAPFIQALFHPFTLVGLSGAFEAEKQPRLSFHNYIEGKLQDSTDAYLKDVTPFKGDMVRLRNQLDYALFNNINTNLILGKDNYIFDPNYIRAREGKDLPPYWAVNVRTQRMIKAVKILDSMHIPVVFVIAPNKANYYAENLPYSSAIGKSTNYSHYKSELLKHNVTVIDADQWFLNLKDKTPYPLIPKYGAHWSIYGSTLVADSVLKTISRIKQKQYATFSVLNYETNDKARFTDDDYLESMNLISRWKSPILAYPVLKYNNGEKPNVLIVSDSYFWNFYDIGIIDSCFAPPSEMWYYNRSIYSSKREKVGPRTKTISLKDIRNRDVILIMATAPSLVNFGYDFFDQIAQGIINE